MINRKSFVLLMVIALLSAALACNMPQGESTSDLAVQPDSALPADGSQPASSISVELGFSREKPFPIDTEVATPFWDFKILEFYRGEQAWQIIQADDANNKPPPAGKEYALVKVWLRNKNPSPNAQNFGLDEFFMTGDALQVHGDVLVDHPVPEVVFTDFFTAETYEGWIDVLVDPAEQNLILVFDRVDSIDGETQPREIRYLALEGNASIEVPPGLEAIPANNLGLEPEEPAKIGEMVIGDDWEVAILEAVTGTAALDIVMQMNEKNDSPEDGMEYIALRARMRRISTQDMKDYRPSFWAYVKDEESESWKTIAEPRIRNKNPELFPIMAFYFFPGLESEGWFVLEAPAGQTPHLATIDVGGDFSTSTRYFQLIP